MAGFRSVKKYAQAWEDGRVFTSHFRKQPGFSPSNVMWVDTSYFGGGPPANYYASAPLVAATLDGTAGIYHGDDKSPAVKRIARFSTVATSNYVGEIRLLDYLLYYPFVDCDDLTAQVMTNSVSLPRYEDGDGVMVMPVCVSTGAGFGTFTFEYVNQNGDVKTSPLQYCTSAAPIPSNIVAAGTFGFATAGMPFCVLGAGDVGVRQINSVTFTAVNGGLMCLVLVKPVLHAPIREGGTQNEVEFMTQMTRPPVVKDGAFLGIIGKFASGNLSGLPLVGAIDFIWDEGT